ncbi:MAG: aspartate-semialdehyde dehydrogenase [Chloroflexi bacterium OLB13]|nr:MAG: aspartate-semialdehyde dehydrogenase [Chloroflexi bacterium OLB13]OQY79449.1 MAG: aspartate-semialdehyde dehydrogenase [Anaerolineae bacterium UTCFX5]
MDNGKLPVAILGATGAVGQRFIQLLEDHPWFEVRELFASERSAGKPYREAANWVLDGGPPSRVGELVVQLLGGAVSSPLVFSALPKEAAVELEPKLAAQGKIVCTNASAYRMTPDVPLLLAEVNGDHVALLDRQRATRGWSTGALIANSNCTAMPVVMTLAPLRQFGVKRVHVVSQQAISGAGYPGVPSMDMIDNVIPYVSGDEEKLETETLKMLGTFDGEQITPLDTRIGASCTRVPVLDGHLVHVSVELEERPTHAQIREAWACFRGSPEVASLPSSPALPVVYLEQHDRPQPRRDRMIGAGMATAVGRLRDCPLLGYKYFALSHNTIRGAAGSSIQNAELLARRGYIDSFRPN